MDEVFLLKYAFNQEFVHIKRPKEKKMFLLLWFNSNLDPTLMSQIIVSLYY